MCIKDPKNADRLAFDGKFGTEWSVLFIRRALRKNRVRKDSIEEAAKRRWVPFHEIKACYHNYLDLPKC